MSCIDDREAFLQEANIAVLATADGQGRPHAAPVWYFYEDGVFTISTDRHSRKHKNISANPNIALTIDKRDLPYFAVIAQGRAELGPMFTPDERLRLAVRYLGEERGKRYVEHTKSEDSITIRLRPAKLVEYHGRLQPRPDA
jgi:PPOX class probable F420-dependent enzyme